MFLPPDHHFTNSVVSAEHRLHHTGSQRLISPKENSASQELHHSGAINKLHSEYKRMVLLTIAPYSIVSDYPVRLSLPTSIYRNCGKTNYTGMNYFLPSCNKNGISRFRLFLIVTIKITRKVICSNAIHIHLHEF